jgi:hypothetical protein
MKEDINNAYDLPLLGRTVAIKLIESRLTVLYYDSGASESSVEEPRRRRGRRTETRGSEESRKLSSERSEEGINANKAYLVAQAAVAPASHEQPGRLELIIFAGPVQGGVLEERNRYT